MWDFIEQVVIVAAGIAAYEGAKKLAQTEQAQAYIAQAKAEIAKLREPQVAP